MENPRDPYIGSPDNPRTAALVSYITFIGWLIAYFGLYPSRHTAYTAFHLRQSLLIHILAFFLDVLFSFSRVLIVWLVLCGVLGIFLFIVWLLGFWDAISGRQRPVPLIGRAAQRLFAGL
jgi:uncharacterized membrane protein